jgi:phage terminase large subunit GpA-like protein
MKKVKCVFCGSWDTTRVATAYKPEYMNAKAYCPHTGQRIDLSIETSNEFRANKDLMIYSCNKCKHLFVKEV